MSAGILSPSKRLSEQGNRALFGFRGARYWMKRCSLYFASTRYHYLLFIKMFISFRKLIIFQVDNLCSNKFSWSSWLYFLLLSRTPEVHLCSIFPPTCSLRIPLSSIPISGNKMTNICDKDPFACKFPQIVPLFCAIQFQQIEAHEPTLTRKVVTIWLVHALNPMILYQTFTITIRHETDAVSHFPFVSDKLLLTNNVLIQKSWDQTSTTSCRKCEKWHGSERVLVQKRDSLISLNCLTAPGDETSLFSPPFFNFSLQICGGFLSCRPHSIALSGPILEAFLSIFYALSEDFLSRRGSGRVSLCYFVANNQKRGNTNFQRESWNCVFFQFFKRRNETENELCLKLDKTCLKQNFWLFSKMTFWKNWNGVLSMSSNRSHCNDSCLKLKCFVSFQKLSIVGKRSNADNCNW